METQSTAGVSSNVEFGNVMVTASLQGGKPNLLGILPQCF